MPSDGNIAIGANEIDFPPVAVRSPSRDRDRLAGDAGATARPNSSYLNDSVH
jgi:hypothetical protein